MSWRAQVGIVLVGAFVTAAVVWFAQSGTGASPREAAPEAVLSGKAVAPQRIRFGPTSQYDLAHGASLTVRVAVPHAERPTVRAAVRSPGHRPILLSEPVPARPKAVQRLRLAVRPGVARALSVCRPRQLEVVVRDRRGHLLARRSRPLPAQPPACSRFFGASSWWNKPLAPDAPVDAWSTTLADSLYREVQREFITGFAPTINTTSYSIPIFVARADQRRTPVHLVGERVIWGGALKRILARGVPMPPDTRAAQGTDANLVVWQPATDELWELWVARSKNGRWEASWGGYMNHVSRSPGTFGRLRGMVQGASASSLPVAGGVITRADLARGEINHALAMAVPITRSSVWALPAQRTDGGVRGEAAVPMGARFRLDPKLDIDSLHLPPFTAMMARAAQRYGIFVRDTAPVVVFVAEDPAGIGANPWPNAIKPSTYQVLKRFPWEHLQVMRMELWTYPGKPLRR